MEYTVSLNFQAIQEEFIKFTPYNIIRDIKKQKLSKQELAEIALSVGDELKHGAGRPAYEILYWEEQHRANYSKIRVDDEKRNNGKSKGFRCIVLVDNINRYGFILHLYRHAHGEDENISAKEKNKLRILVDEYIIELNGEKK